MTFNYISAERDSFHFKYSDTCQISSANKASDSNQKKKCLPTYVTASLGRLQQLSPIWSDVTCYILYFQIICAVTYVFFCRTIIFALLIDSGVCCNNHLLIYASSFFFYRKYVKCMARNNLETSQKIIKNIFIDKMLYCFGKYIFIRVYWEKFNKQNKTIERTQRSTLAGSQGRHRDEQFEIKSSRF